MGAGGAGLTACGGDDTTIGGSDSGTDGTTADSSTDGSSDATFDGSDADAGDGSPGFGDGGGDSGGDGGRDAGDGGEGGIDDSAILASFQQQLATTYCTAFAKGCASVDAGTVNIATCVASINHGPMPVLNSSSANYDDTTATSRGDVGYNATNAHLCLTEVAAIDFANVQAASYLQALQDCFEVASGTLPLKAGCYASLECAAGSYCKTGAYDGGVPDAGSDAGDAGPPPFTGACEPLEPAGTICDNYPAGDSCSYLGIPGGAFCDYPSATADDETCQSTPAAIGGPSYGCSGDQDCASGLCDRKTSFCTSSTTSFVLPKFCTAYP